MLKEDIFKLNFSDIFASGNHIFSTGMPTGQIWQNMCSPEALPHRRHKGNIVVVYDITDDRFFMSPHHTLELTDSHDSGWPILVSPFDELIPLYDFLSCNRIPFATPPESLNQTLFHDHEHCAELETLWKNNSAPRRLKPATGFIFR